MTCELYERVLGSAWRTLAEPVRRAHAVGEERRGLFRVSQGTGWWLRLLARWSHLPQPAGAVEVRLRIIDDGSGQRWERQFNGHAFTTRQWADHRGYLVEKFQSWELHFQLQASAETLRYVQQSARFCLGRWRFSWPLALAPRVSATETSDGPNRVRVSVAVTLPLLGVLLAYEGVLEIGGPA